MTGEVLPYALFLPSVLTCTHVDLCLFFQNCPLKNILAGPTARPKGAACVGPAGVQYTHFCTLCTYVEMTGIATAQGKLIPVF